MPSSRGLLRARFTHHRDQNGPTAATPPLVNRPRDSTDSNILRGAAIIRQQIQNQWEQYDDDEVFDMMEKKMKDQEQQYYHSSSSTDKPSSEDNTNSFSSEDYDYDDDDDEFSDPWADQKKVIKQVVRPPLAAVTTKKTRSSTTTQSSSSCGTESFKTFGDASQWAEDAMLRPITTATTTTATATTTARTTTKRATRRSTPDARPPTPAVGRQQQQQQHQLKTRPPSAPLPPAMSLLDADRYIVEPLHVPTCDEDDEENEPQQQQQQFQRDSPRQQQQRARGGYDFVGEDGESGELLSAGSEGILKHSYLPNGLRASNTSRGGELLGDDDDEPEPFLSPSDDLLEEEMLMDKAPVVIDQVQRMEYPQSRGLVLSSKIPNTTVLAVPSPLTSNYNKLVADPAFRHAQNAGHLWQSLLGNHIRFPKSWWECRNNDGSAAASTGTPPMGLDEPGRRWWYYGRFQTYNPLLHRFVKHRSAPGRLILHVIVRDTETWCPLLDLVVGCLHPAARFIRETDQADPNQDDCRDLWIAVRKRCEKTSSVEQLLSRCCSWDKEGGPTLVGPLGPDRRMTNQNVRPTFGESPPLETIFVPEPELYERLAASDTVSPAMVLLREFVFA